MIPASLAGVSPLSNSFASTSGTAMLATVVRVLWVVGLLLAGFGSGVEVRAAGELTGSNPSDEATLDAVPERVELSFDHSVDPETVQIVVIAPNGARADTGITETVADGTRSAVPRPGLADGRYLVYWVVAEPGSRASAFGDISFTVAGASPCQPPSNATPRPPAAECVPDPPTGAPGTAIESNGIFVTLMTSSNQAGPVDVQALVTDPAGNPVEDATVWFRARHLEMDHGELPYLAAQPAPGTYQAGSMGMGMGGEWRIAIDVIRPGELPETIFVEQTMVE